MYIDDIILPEFNKWIQSLTIPVTFDQAKKYARYFIIHHIDPLKISSRGEVYDLFEDVYEYANMRKKLYTGMLDSTEMLRLNNLHNIAQGVVWAMEHDAFDILKYDPIAKWGMDIYTMRDQKI